MKYSQKINIILVIFALMMPGFVSASGIISQQIEIKDAMRGQTIEELLSAVNSGDSEITFELSADGDIADWVSFKKSGDIEGLISAITAPPKDWAKARVFIKVPDDTPNGEYDGHLIALISSANPNLKQKDDVSVSVSQKFRRPVKIIVTDIEIVKFRTKVMPEKYLISKIEPLKIKLIYTNQGNISIRPQAQIKIFNPDSKEIFNAIYPYPENEAPVRPRATKTITVVHHSGELKEGRYKAEAIITLNGEEKYRDDFHFTVGSVADGVVAGAEDSNIDKLFGFLSSVGGSNPVKGWFIIGGAFLIIAQVLIIINRRKGQNKKI